MKIKGSITALATPLLQDRVDLEALQALIERQSQAGTDGLVIAGSTGEGGLLSAQERKEMLRIAVQTNRTLDHPMTIIAGCGTSSTATTLEGIQQAEACGVDAIMVVSPSYVRPSQEGAFQHFSRAAQATTLPIVLYNHPGRTGFTLHNETVLRLTETNTNIVALKDSSPDLSRIADLHRSLPEDFALLSGDDAINIGFLAQGGKGIISVTGNLFPKINEIFMKFWDNGKVRQAQEIHEALMPLHQAMFCEPNPSPVIYGLSKICGIANKVRLPLLPVQFNSTSAHHIEKAINTVEEFQGRILKTSLGC